MGNLEGSPNNVAVLRGWGSEKEERWKGSGGSERGGN